MKEITVEMARASDEDIQNICDLATFLDCVDDGRWPDSDEAFHELDDEDCRRFTEEVLRRLRRRPGSLFRVVFGFSTIAWEANDILDRNSDTLQLSPTLQRKGS